MVPPTRLTDNVQFFVTSISSDFVRRYPEKNHNIICISYVYDYLLIIKMLYEYYMNILHIIDPDAPFRVVMFQNARPAECRRIFF